MTPSTQNEWEKQQLIELTNKRKRMALELMSFFNGVCEMEKPFEKDDLDTLVSKMVAILENELKSQQDRILQMVEERVICLDDNKDLPANSLEMHHYNVKVYARNEMRAEQRIKLAQIKEALK